MAQQVISPTAPTAQIRPAPPVPPTPTVRAAGGPYLAWIIPSDEGALTAQAMENWFQACASDEAFSLELVGTRRAQGFVLRAHTEEQWNLLCKQLEAQYPQCEIQRVDPADDPLHLKSGEYALIGEFALLHESWMPLKTFTGKALSETGADPLAGILAAMEAVGSGQRVVVQLSLVRAQDNWLGANVRKGVEHALQHERDAVSLATKGASARSDAQQGIRLITIMGLLFAGILGYRWYQAHAWLPLWLLGAGALAAFVGLLWWNLIRNAHPIYDMKMVADKMAKAGFYCQLRAFIVTREPVAPRSATDLQRETDLRQMEHHDLTLQNQLANWEAHMQAARQQRDAYHALPADQQDPAALLQIDHTTEVLDRWITEAHATRDQLRARMREAHRQVRTRTRERERERKRLLLAQQGALSPCLTGLEVAYRQFTQASANGLYLKRTRIVHASDKEAAALPDARQAFPYARGLARLLHRGAYSPTILNSLELAGMFHLPQEHADLPLVRRTTVKRLLASPEIAHQITRTPAPLPPALIGASTHRRYRVPVLLPFDALFSHKAAFGMSRSGKTVLMQLLIAAAMQRVRDATTPQPGVFAIDPHRDFVMDILKLIAGNPELEQRLVLLDMTDTAFPVALNPLDASMGFTRDQAVSNLMSSFREIWRDYWGPRMAYFLNAVCLLLYTLNQQLVAEGHADRQYTLLDINPLLQYKDYALTVLARLDMSETWHRELLGWWKNTYFTLPTNSSFRQEVIMPILSKIGVFNDNSQLRNIVGQPVTKAPVHLAVREGKIVLCALSTKDMSDEAVNILGSTLVNLLHSSFSLQQSLPLTKRRKVFCALDEFHAFSGSQLDRMLSEDAKLGCSMLLATQNLKRLNKIRDGLMEMVFSNCQQLFAFRVSAADARILEEELQERVSQKHIISQPALHCYARLSMTGYPMQIVSAQLAKPASWGDDPRRDARVEHLLTTARRQYLPVAEVERRYAEHLDQFLDVTAYAAKIDRDVRAAADNKRTLDEAAERAEQIQQDQATAQGASANNAGQQPPDASAPTAKRSRNHRRSRRMGKHPVGMPPPDTTSSTEATASEPDDEQVIDALRPLPFPTGTTWKTSPRERERPE